MSDENKVHLSLLGNSHGFLREAVRKALAAQEDIREWQFAIILLVQSLELSLKAMLNTVHPILIYENIDAPKHTVSPMQALGRLQNPKIASVEISDQERRKIENALSLRNEVTHSDFELKSEYASAKFFEMFAFVMYFQGRHLDTEFEDVVDTEDLDQLLRIAKSDREIVEKAERRIAEEGISGDLIWACPNCGNDTFIAEDGIETCYTCRYADKVVECPHCDKFYFEFEIESFFDELDIDYCEGLETVHNSFGYSEFSACQECLPRIREDIQKQRWEEEDFYRSLEEKYYREKRGRRGED